MSLTPFQLYPSFLTVNLASLYSWLLIKSAIILCFSAPKTGDTSQPQSIVAALTEFPDVTNNDNATSNPPNSVNHFFILLPPFLKLPYFIRSFSTISFKKLGKIFDNCHFLCQFRVDCWYQIPSGC